MYKVRVWCNSYVNATYDAVIAGCYVTISDDHDWLKDKLFTSPEEAKRASEDYGEKIQIIEVL